MQSSIDLLSNQAKCNAAETRSDKQKPDFIKHLQGLRGLAILMILLFHLLPDYFSQGFLGVEVFLVISGYLLFRGWKEGESFNLFTFTQKKIVRIVPMICLLVIATICIFSAIATMENLTFRFLGTSALCSILGISNEYYISRYSDYFSPGANMNPLLHTWYLSVTIQTYAIWGLGSWVLWRFHRLVRIAIVFIVAILSFCYDYLPEIQTTLNCLGADLQVSNDASYYGTANRLWQVLAGGLVFILPTKLNKVTANWTSSISLIVLLYAAYCNDSSLDSSAPVIAIICATLLLWCLPCSDVKKITELKGLTWLGSISFSLYMVHFPIIVLYKYWERELPTISTSFLIILPIILVISYGVWHFIEKRKISIWVTAILFVLAALIALAGRNSHKLGFEMLSIPYPAYNGPVQYAHPDTLKHFDATQLCGNDGTISLLYNIRNAPAPPILALGNPSTPPEYIMVGDSHAQHFFSGFNALSERLGISGIHFTTIVIPLWDTYINSGGGYNWDETKAQAFLNWLSKHPETHTVVISQYWKHRLQEQSFMNWKLRHEITSFNKQVALMKKFCEELKRAGKQVVLVSPSPRLFNFESEIHGSTNEYFNWLHERGKATDSNLPDSFVMTESEYYQNYTDILALFDSLEKEGVCRILHIEKGIFRQGNFSGCRDGVLRMRDNGHVTPVESIEIIDSVADDFKQIIDAGRTMQQQTTR